MKESIWGYWIVVLGIAIVGLMTFLHNYTTTSEQDYYLIKSALEASMLESVDYSYYRDTGIYKMNEEKFVENFVRRFSATVNINKTYDINFYTISEVPPLASVSVTTKGGQLNTGEGQTGTSEEDVTNRLTAILYTSSGYVPLS